MASDSKSLTRLSPPHFMLVTGPCCYLYFSPTNHKLDIPRTSPSASINLLRVPHRTQRHILVTRLPDYYERIWFRKSQMEEMKRQGVRKGFRASMPSPGTTLLSPPCAHQREGSRNCSFEILMEASLERLDWLNHWSLCDFNHQPLSPPLPGGCRGSGPGRSNSLRTWLFLWQLTSLFRLPKGFSKSLLVNITKQLITGFKELCARNRV